MMNEEINVFQQILMFHTVLHRFSAGVQESGLFVMSCSVR